jgi:hypothetical protein
MMVWLFLSVLLVVVVYLAIQSQGFRKTLRVCLAVPFILAVGVVGWLYYLKIEGDKQEELSRRLIRPDEIIFTDTLLGQSSGSWRVKGNVTNRSSHELSGFGEKEVSTYLSVPPNQMRAFEEFISLRDMPESKKWGWTYTVQEVRGKVK